MRNGKHNRTAPVVVCGAGAAGMAAALSAARLGQPVYLIESGDRIGGTVTQALIHTLGGLYDSAGQLINGSLPAELVRRLSRADAGVRPRQMGSLWVLSVCPELYRRVVEAWVAAERRITVLPLSHVSRVISTSGQRIEMIEVNRAGRSDRLYPRAVVDATGTGELVRAIDASLVADSGQRSAGGWIFTFRGVVPGALAFPRGLAAVRSLHQAAADGRLPPECGHAWIDTGVCEDEVYVKLLVPLPGDWRSRRADIVGQARRTQAAITDFLLQRPEFSRAAPTRTGMLGVRDGGRIRGEYCLTAEDVRRQRKFDDAACRCSWPIEYWDADEGVSLEYLPENEYYEIPLRSLKLRGFANVWMAGKCLSADKWAQASARVVGTCWAMGEAAGIAAAS